MAAAKGAAADPLRAVETAAAAAAGAGDRGAALGATAVAVRGWKRGSRAEVASAASLTVAEALVSKLYFTFALRKTHHLGSNGPVQQ